ncbi:MAG: IS5 family transposase [Candidatus Bathyarchaeota archaeon]|nr:IS5 family transposase [Candidatus Bathyarchaeota archaeon]
MDWKDVDERLIRRGGLILDLDFLEDYDKELEAMNRGKEGRPFTLTHSHIRFLAVVRYLFDMPYRQLEGFARALHRLVPRLPSGDYSGLRRRILGLDLAPYEHLREVDEPIAIAVDSTGIKVHRAGGWVERKHGKRNRYVKVHFAVNVETGEVVAMEVTTDDAHDSKALASLLEQSEEHGRVVRLYGDGAYDSSEIYEALASRGIEAVIKPRGSSRPDTPSPARRRVVREYLSLGHDAWAGLKGYGKRWMVETVYYTFKRAFGEHCVARTFRNIVKELVAKATIYNMLVNL